MSKGKAKQKQRAEAKADAGEIKIEVPKRDLVGIGVPSGDHVHADFSMALAAMTYFGRPNTGFALISGKSSIVTTSRNMIVNEALKATDKEGNPLQWLLFLDSDMTFPADTLRRLMAHDKDIVGAIYCRRAGNHEPHGIPMDKAVYGKRLTTGLIEMEKMPTGVLLIKLDVFRRMARPFFRIFYQDADEQYPEGLTFGEDYNFSDQARALGYQLWCDVELSHQVGHIGTERFVVRDVE